MPTHNEVAIPKECWEGTAELRLVKGLNKEIKSKKKQFDVSKEIPASFILNK